MRLFALALALCAAAVPAYANDPQPVEELRELTLQLMQKHPRYHDSSITIARVERDSLTVKTNCLDRGASRATEAWLAARVARFGTTRTVHICARLNQASRLYYFHFRDPEMDYHEVQRYD